MLDTADSKECTDDEQSEQFGEHKARTHDGHSALSEAAG